MRRNDGRGGGARRGRWAIALLGFGLAAIAMRAVENPGLPLADDRWRHFASPHFELYSRKGERESRELLHNLEILRAVFLERMHVVERLHVDVTVYFFDSEKGFRAYAPPQFQGRSDFAGFHTFLPDRAVITLAPAGGDEAQQTIFHEFVHHLFRVTESDPPLWFNEGTADLFAGMQVERKRVLIGSPLVDRALYLREESLLPLEQLFDADQNSRIYADERHTGVFYAEAWALLHYWEFGQSGIPRENVTRFLQVAGSRETAGAGDLAALFRQCFGCDYAEMLQRLRKYIRTGRFRMGAEPMPDLAPASSYAMRRVPVDEMTVRLAELSVRVEDSAMGKLVLLNAMKERPQDPRPLETLGTRAYLDHDEDLAAQRWEQALAAGSKNPAVIRELALMEGRRWFEQFDLSFRMAPATTERLRGRLLQSIALEPAQSAAFEMLAWVEAFAEKPNAKNINRVIERLPAMKEKRRTLIAVTAIMLRLKRPADAQATLAYLEKLHLEDEDARAVAKLRERLDADFPDAAGAAVAPPGAKAIAPPPAKPGLKTPSVDVPDNL